MLNSKSIHPFTGVEFDKTVGTYRIITYQAYNACGLIGPEKNGIAVLDNAARTIVLDEHFKQQTGYYGVGQAVIDEADLICNMIANNFQEFRAFVNNHPRKRFAI